MATLKSQIQGLIDYANETTGAGDTLLGDAVKTLCDGYGQGGGGGATHNVKWVDFNGTILKEEEVVDGGSSSAPAVPSHPHITFDDWCYGDVMANITEDCYNIARYHANDPDKAVLKVDTEGNGSMVGFYCDKGKQFGNVRINWGDGTVEDIAGNWQKYYQHIYASEFHGYAIVEATDTNLLWGASSTSTAAYRQRYVTEAYIGDNIQLRYNNFMQSQDLVGVVCSTIIQSNMTNPFDGCVKLKAFAFREGVTTIVGAAFRGCSELEYCYLPQSITYIGNSAFQECTKLNMEINLPNLITLGTSATTGQIYCFYNCVSLKRVVSLGKIAYIPASAFQGCTSLEEVVLPSTIATIATAAFYGCAALRKMELPQSITAINGTAFYGCQSWEVDIDLPNLTVLGNAAITANTNTFYNCAKIRRVLNLGRITLINRQVFYGCSGITEFIIPSSVTTIGTGAFNYAFARDTEIIIPSNVTKLEASSFANTKLKAIKGGEGVTTIETYVFQSAYLEEIHISHGLATIANANFLSNNYRLRRLEIADGWLPPVDLTLSFNGLMTADEMMLVINNLGDNTGKTARKIIFGSTNLTRLSAEQKAVATAKNYTLA